MAKKQSATIVNHRDSEKTKLQKKECIEIEIFKRISNPRSVESAKLYKILNPKPSDSLAFEIAQWSANNSNNVRFEQWDLSRPDETPYSRKAYVFVAETTKKQMIEELKREINIVEQNYRTKLREINRKIGKRPTVIEAISS